jgi:hypothetical protein
MWTLEQENLSDFYRWSEVHSDFYIEDHRAWDTESLNTQFYGAEMAAWSSVFTEYTFEDRDTWQTSARERTMFLGVSEAPENIDLFPEDFYLDPEDIQADEEDWTIFSEAD